MANDRELEGILEDDAFLDALAEGKDSTEGQDPLASLFLGMREEVYAPLPPTPQVDALLGATVVDMHAHKKDSKRRISGLSHALVGAAAATVLIAGAGSAIYNASPGSALWDLNQTLFKEHAAVVELATTLDEIGERSDNGDAQGAMELLDQAKNIVASIADSQSSQSSNIFTTITDTSTVTETITSTVPVTISSVPAPQRAVEPTSTYTAPAEAQRTEENLPTTRSQNLPDGVIVQEQQPADNGNNNNQNNQGNQNNQNNQPNPTPAFNDPERNNERQPSGRVGDVGRIGEETDNFPDTEGFNR